MSLTTLSDALPAYATDIKTNIARLVADTVLSDQQKWGCLLACAFAIGQPDLLDAVEAEARPRLSEEAVSAARTSATIMAMNTVYYGAVNLLRNHDYRADPSQLIMPSLTSPGVDKIDFELWALAVSALSNSEACLNTHEAELHKRGVALERILASLRIAAVVNATATVIRAEGPPTRSA